MDQAPRTAFIAAVVRPEERTGVMGITSMVRTFAMSMGPSVTGVLAGNDKFYAAFLATGICRVVYDVGLWVLFVNFKVDGTSAIRGEENSDRDNIDEAAWNELLGDTDSDGEGSWDGRKSKDEERGEI